MKKCYQISIYLRWIKLQYSIFGNIIYFHPFQEDILKNPPQGVDESIFIRSSKLHLTLVVMSLLDDEERTFASDLLQDAKQSIIEYVFESEHLFL